jgi:ketosteroid isomerase-like protein
VTGTASSALLDDFFAAIERGDLEAVAAAYADEVQVWHNVTGAALDKPASVDLLRYWCSRVDGRRYEVLERSEYDGGVVQRHVVRGTVDGKPLAADVCIVFHLDGRSITRIYEYLDPASVASVFGAPRATGEG